MACFDAAAQLQGRKPIINRINRFLATPWYVAATMLLTGAAHILQLELAAYSIFAAVTVYICLLGSDLLGLMPIVICCYILPSAGNNPGRNEASVFSLAGGGIYIACLAVIIALAIIYRVIKDRHTFFAKKRTLMPGMLVLMGAYVLSGIGSEAYPDAAAKNIFFSLLQGGAIILPYWLFSGGVDWKKARNDYLAWIGFGVGGVLMVQILWLYCTSNVVIDGIINRKHIYTGWGMYNNIGAMLAMMIPFAFYLATKYRRGWLGTVVGSAFLICVLLTCSRSSILGATAIYCLCVLLMLYYARNRRHNTIALITVGGIILLAAGLFHEQLLRLFSDLLQKGLDPSTRDDIYREGLELFTQAPVFGSSFYPPDYQPWTWSTAEGFSQFFPPRWHNTVIQLLASCGLVGLGAYLVHRQQTLRMLLCIRSKEKTFIFCAVLVLLGCSLFDCHFFNIGPVLFYSMALAFAENS